MKFLIMTTVLLNTLLFAVSGEEVFKAKCASCHQYYIPQNKIIANAEHNNTDLNLTAPTLTEMSFMLKDQVGDRKTDAEGQKFQIEDWLTGYLADPSKEKGVISKKFTRFFGKMPSMKGQLNEDDIEALADFMYEYAEKMMRRHGVRRYSYDAAKQIAKKEGKIILIEGYIPYCRWCMRMDREVMVEPEVKAALNKKFVLVKMNLLTQKLPLGMKRLGTPSFYFIGSDGKTVIDTVEGFGNKEEFLDLLKSIEAH